MTLDKAQPPPDAASAVDPRVEHSRRMLKETLVELARGSSPEKISVSALCKAAGVSRPTFYQHFDDIDDVYSAHIEDKLNAFGEELEQNVATGAPVEEYIAQTVARLDVTGPRYVHVLSAGGVLPRARTTVHRWMSGFCARTNYGRPESELSPEERYRVSFLVGGAMSVMGERIMHPDTLTPEEITALLTSLARGTVPSPKR
jgi:AcrR family transcriptional regulator